MGWIAREWKEAKDATIELGGFLKKHDYKKSAKSLFSFQNWGLKLAVIILVVGTTTLSIYHHQIVTAFEPKKSLITSYPASWVIPIILLILVSFPPLFGHELIILVVGLIYGLLYGFIIAAVGTFLGEMLCFVAFKYYFVEKARKIEEESILYGALARLMREGGLGMLVLVRFSVLPGHVVSAVQSTIGTNIWLYSIAVVLSLPKQLSIVYLGVIFGQTTSTTDPNSSAASLKKQRIISLSVFGVTTFISLVAFFFIWTRARRYYRVIEEERKLRDGGGLEGGEGVPLGFSVVGGGEGGGGYKAGYGGGYTSGQEGGREGWTGFNNGTDTLGREGGREEEEYSNVPIYQSNNSRKGGNGSEGEGYDLNQGYDHTTYNPSSSQSQPQSQQQQQQQYSQPSPQQHYLDPHQPRGFPGAGGSGNSSRSDTPPIHNETNTSNRELSLSRERLLLEEDTRRQRERFEFENSKSRRNDTSERVVEGGIEYRRS